MATDREKLTDLHSSIKMLRDEWQDALNMEEIYAHHAADRLDEILEGVFHE